MIVKSITFETYDTPPKTVTQDFYFNISKREALKMNVKYEGGLEGHLRRIAEAQSNEEAYQLFEDVLSEAIGRRGADGIEFEKDPEWTRKFLNSQASDELIIWCLNNAEEAAKFINGMLPDKAQREFAEDLAAEGDSPIQPYQAPERPKPESPLAMKPEERQRPRVVERPTEDVPIADPKDTRTKWDEYTREELLAMSRDDFEKLAGSDPRKMDKPLLEIAFARKTSN